MQSCPRRFFYQYVERAPPEFLSSSLLFGGAVHRLLELHYRARLEGLATTPEALLSAYRDGWQRQSAEAGNRVPVRFCKNETVDVLEALAGRMIRAFLASPISRPAGTVLAVEEERTVRLADDLPDLLARMDLITEELDPPQAGAPPGPTVSSSPADVIAGRSSSRAPVEPAAAGRRHWCITDFKTSRSRWNPARARQSADQLRLYALAAAGITEADPVMLRFAILTKAKSPVVQVLPVGQVLPGVPAPSAAQSSAVDPPDLAVDPLTASTRQVWQAIQAGHFYPSPSPQHCSNCPFQTRCPAMKQ